MTLCNLYAPNQDNVSFFAEAFALVEKFENGKVIIRGDFNMTIKDKDKKGGRSGPGHPKSALIVTYMENKGLMDIWKS